MKKEVLLALIIPVEILAAYYAGWVSFAIGVAFAVSAFLGIHLLTDKLVLTIIRKAIMRDVTKKSNIVFFTSVRYRKPFEGFDGFVNLHIKLLYVIFLFVLFVMKNVKVETIQEFWLSLLIAIVSSFIVAPLAIPYWLIYSTRVRILNPEGATIDYVGTVLRPLYRWLLGVANLVGLFYLFISFVKDLGLTDGAVRFVQVVALVFGSVGVGALLTTALLYAVKRDKVNGVLDLFESDASSYATPADEVVNIFKGMVYEEEGEKIVPEAKVQEAAPEAPEAEEGEEEGGAEETDVRTGEAETGAEE